MNIGKARNVNVEVPLKGHNVVLEKKFKHQYFSIYNINEVMIKHFSTSE